MGSGKKTFLFLIFLLIGFGVFFWIIKIVGWQGIKEAISRIKGWQGLSILGLSFLIIIVSTWKWREVLKSQGVSVSFAELLKLYLGGFSILFLAPMIVFGGEIFRSYALGKRKGVPFSKRLASVFIDRVLEYTVQFLLLFFGVLFFLFKIGFSSLKITLFLGGIFLVFILVLTFFYFKVFRKESLLQFFLEKFLRKKISENNRFLEVEKEVFKFFHPKAKWMWKGFGLAFLRSAVALLRTWVLIIFLGKVLGFVSVVSVLGFSYLSLMLPIPTAIGSHEAAQFFVFKFLELPVTAAPAFTMIIRGAELIIALIGVLILFKIGFGLIKNILLDTISKFTLNFNNNNKHYNNK